MQQHGRTWKTLSCINKTVIEGHTLNDFTYMRYVKYSNLQKQKEFWLLWTEGRRKREIIIQ